MNAQKRSRRFVARRKLLLHAGLFSVAIVSTTAVIVAFWAATDIKYSDLSPNAVLNSSLAVLLSLVAAHASYLSTDRVPGETPRFFLVFALSLTFFLVVSALLFFRAEYNRAVLGGGYAGSVIWYIVATIFLRRNERGKIGFLDINAAGKLLPIGFVDWVLIYKPVSSPPDIDALAIEGGAQRGEKWQQFITDCKISGIPVYEIHELAEKLTGKVNLDEISPSETGFLTWGRSYLLLRNLTGRLLALLVLPFALGLIAIIGIAIKLDDKGPIFYSQKRTGVDRKQFSMLKLRTMTHRTASVSASVDAAQTRENDNRITRVGRALRKTRLDELPQILNILMGQMSWIGPRPHPVELSEWYRQEIPQYDLRYLVPPGITGWAQVNQGHVNELDSVRDKVAYDLFYARHVSFSLDILIVLKTLHVIFTGTGAK